MKVVLLSAVFFCLVQGNSGKCLLGSPGEGRTSISAEDSVEVQTEVTDGRPLWGPGLGYFHNEEIWEF